MRIDRICVETDESIVENNLFNRLLLQLSRNHNILTTSYEMYYRECKMRASPPDKTMQSSRVACGIQGRQ